METLRWINYIISIVFIICYSYQFVYIPIVWFFNKKKLDVKNNKENRYAILICARNEREVIADLLNSIKQQSYNQKLIDTFVLADNCSDDTFDIASTLATKVYKRFNKEKVGKGYALNDLIHNILRDYGDIYDGYFIFDADNILEKDYIEQMNKSFNSGNKIITSYRNSKNYGVNWISAGYGLWFLRESRYLNNAREIINSSCSISGTGFLISKEIIQENNGWPFHLLTEDIEFSIDQIVKGNRIAFCKEAILYDEQPVTFIQSWHQRKRWSKGFFQVFSKYGKSLFINTLKGNYSCFDMLCNIAPAFILFFVSIVCNGFSIIYSLINNYSISLALSSLLQLFVNSYLMFYIIGLITTISEWKQIKTSNIKKVLYTFTFPIFMFTYIPISISALITKTEWKQIKHTYSLDKIKLG